MKSLIIYYSRDGNTQLVSKVISKEINSDLQKIQDLKKRTGILGYIIAGKDAMQENMTKIKPETADIKKYDYIMIGTPVWGWKLTPAINTIIDKLDFRGKQVILFATMGGNNDTRTIKLMKEKVTAHNGKVIHSFSVKTGGVGKSILIEKAKEAAKDIKKIIK